MGLRPRHRTIIAGLAAAALLGSAGCTLVRGDEPEWETGGTIPVAVTAWPVHLDPQRAGSPTEVNLSVLINRTLTTFRPEPGAEGTEVVPDLATDTGRPSQDHTVWEFTLAEGVLWADGGPVTCQDLKYGVQRRYSRDEDRQSGSTAPFQYLRDNPEPYQGPWVAGNNDGAGLESIECLDQQVIRYHLAKPMADFNQVVALPVFAPVRPGADDDRARYDQLPLATGPYLVAEHRIDPAAPAEDRLVLERNPHWRPDSDPRRPAHPDRIVVQPTGSAAATTDALIDDAGVDRNRILLDTDLPPTFVQQVMTDPRLRQRVAAGLSGTVQYLAVDTGRIPDPPCRQALAYAIDKRALRSAIGGQLRGELATTMIPPTSPAHLAFDHYGTGELPAGQPERAREILDEAAAGGIDCPTELSLAHPDTAELRRAASAVVDALWRVGVVVRPVPIAPADYLTADGVLGDGEWELTWDTLTPAWPNGSAVIPELFDGRASSPGRAGNLSRLDDDRIHGLIDAAFAEGDLDRQHQLWGELDRELVQLAVAIPLIYHNALRMHGSNVQGAFVHPWLGMPDISALALVDPTLTPPTPQ